MIESDFEWKFLGKYAGIVLAALCGTALSIYLALPGEEAGSYAEAIRSLATADDALLGAIAVALAAEALVISGAVVLVSILTSHKIAGPVYKLGAALERLVTGPGAGPIRYRENDQVRETAETFNGMLAGLKDGFRAADDACAKVAEAAGAAEGTPGSRARLKEEIDRLEESLNRFTL